MDYNLHDTQADDFCGLPEWAVKKLESGQKIRITNDEFNWYIDDALIGGSKYIKTGLLKINKVSASVSAAVSERLP